MMARFKYDDSVNLLYSSLVSILNRDFDKAAYQLKKYSGSDPRMRSGIDFYSGVINLLEGDKRSAMEFLKNATGEKGVFCFLSNIWLAALYALDGDVYNFIRAKGSMTRCLF